MDTRWEWKFASEKSHLLLLNMFDYDYVSDKNLNLVYSDFTYKLCDKNEALSNICIILPNFFRLNGIIIALDWIFLGDLL